MCCEDCDKKAKVYYNYCGIKICQRCWDKNYEVVNLTAQPKKHKKNSNII